MHLGKTLGFRTANVDNKAGYIEMGEGDEMIAVLGHLDVVPVGDDWTYPPFGAEIHDGILYGRGVADDKGPTIGAIYAMKAIRDLGLPTDRRIRVIFGTNEERGCDCIKHYVEAGEEHPVLGIIPGRGVSAHLFEKGMTTVIGGKKHPKQGKNPCPFVSRRDSRKYRTIALSVGIGRRTRDTGYPRNSGNGL